LEEGFFSRVEVTSSKIKFKVSNLVLQLISPKLYLI